MLTHNCLLVKRIWMRKNKWLKILPVHIKWWLRFFEKWSAHTCSCGFGWGRSSASKIDFKITMLNYYLKMMFLTRRTRVRALIRWTRLYAHACFSLRLSDIEWANWLDLVVPRSIFKTHTCAKTKNHLTRYLCSTINISILWQQRRNKVGFLCLECDGLLALLSYSWV